jgi:hypothetical protein
MHWRDILYLIYCANAVLTALILLITTSFFIINYRSVELSVGITYNDSYTYNTSPCAYLPTNSKVCGLEYTILNDTCVQNNMYCYNNIPSDPKPEHYYEPKVISSRFLDNSVIYLLLVVGIVILLSPVLFLFIECFIRSNGHTIMLVVYILLSIVYVSTSLTSVWIFSIGDTYQPIKYCSFVCNSDYYIDTSINYDIYWSCCNIYYPEINFNPGNVPSGNDIFEALILLLISILLLGQFLAMILLRLLIANRENISEIL